MDMRNEMFRTALARGHWTWALALLALTTPALWAADGLSGDWTTSSDFNGRAMVSTLSLAQKADGTWTGRWGGSELSNVKVDGQKLSFVRTMKFGDNEFSMTFNGTLKDGKIAGTMSSDQGESTVTAVRKKVKSPVLGQWDMTFNVGGDREINGLLTVTEKQDGTLDAKWTKEPGQHAVSNVKFQDGKLTLTRKSNIPDMGEVEVSYEGTVKGNEMTGAWKSQMGDFAAKAKRIGGDLIGKWELTVTNDRGTRTTLMSVDGDMTGTYETFGGEMPMKDIKLDGSQVTFAIEMSFNDQTFKQEFKGKIDGKTLKGQIVSERGTSEVTGKKLDAAPAAAAATSVAAATAAPAGLVGTWEMTSAGRDGTPRTNTLKIKADMTGTYSGMNNETAIKDLKLEGNQVTFKYTRDLNGQEFTMEFKGKLEGSTLNGEFVSERGNRPVTGKKVN
jgi:hypothetical protein